jgi:hypothetical protein
MTGAQFEIRIDGTPRSYRDRKDYAMEAAPHQKQESAQHGRGHRLAEWRRSGGGGERLNEGQLEQRGAPTFALMAVAQAGCAEACTTGARA